MLMMTLTERRQATWCVKQTTYRWCIDLKKMLDVKDTEKDEGEQHRWIKEEEKIR